MLGLLSILAALAAPDFTADQGQAAKDYGPARQRLSVLLATGDLEGAQKLFLDTVPPEKRTAAHCLMLGDTFVALDPEFSRKQHARAFELDPDEAQIAQAWATELHRAGRCAEAEPIYARLASSRGDWFAGAQRIDCLVRTGRLAEALEAWRATRNSPSLAKIFRVLPERIATGETREHRRLVRRKAIAAGASEGAEELVFLDLVGRGGARRFEVERLELEADRKLIGEHLDPESRRAHELWSVCDFWVALSERGFPPAAAGDFAAKYGEPMRELGWLEAGGDVPGHPLVARWATTALLEGGLRQPGELLADWERALASRLEEGEAEAGRALLEIQRAAGSAQAPETEQLLWAKAHDLEAALALLGRRAERLEASDPLLRGALERYPRSARLCALASECARREGKGEREALARAIAAGFQPPGDLECVQSAFERLDTLLSADERR
jgi:hypothetical protein